MDRNVKIRIKIDFKAMKYFNMYNLLYRKRFVYLYVGLTVLCLGASVYSFFFATPEPNYLLGGVFALFAVYLIYQTLNLEKMIDRNIMNYFYNKRPVEQDLTMTDDTITITSPTDPTKTVTYDWIQITSIYEIPQFVYLYIGKHPIIIDKDPNAVLEGSHQDLLDIVKEKASGKPYKLIDKEIVKNPITYVHQEFNDAEEIKPQVDASSEYTSEDTQIVEDVDADNVEDVNEEKEKND